MKKIIILIIAFINYSTIYCQRIDDPRWDYDSMDDPDFKTTSQMVTFFNKNIKDLDPIEGIYDVDMVAKTGSLWAEDLYFHNTLCVVKSQFSSEMFKDEYTVYLSDGTSVSRVRFWFIKIGETNVYRAKWNNESSTQAYLENNLRLKFNIRLTSDDAKEFSKNPNFTNWIVLCFSMIKKYPTSSMY